MTDIIDFEEAKKRLQSQEVTPKKESQQVFELSNLILGGCNRIYDAKLSGALKEDEFSKVLIAEGKLFSNKVIKGEKTEEDVENFENQLPDGKNPYFTFSHKDLDVAKSTIKQTNTVALFDAESLDIRTQITDSYSKGLRKVS